VLDYTVEPEVECSNDDPNDVAFIQVTATIGARTLLESSWPVRCSLWPLASALET
jgi:hypothetical protein